MLVLLATAVLTACGGGNSSSSGNGGGDTGSGLGDPDEGAARLQAQRPQVDRAGASLGKALAEKLGGTTETGPMQYDLCSSAPVEGLSYYAQWRIRDPEPAPTLDAATAAAKAAGWKIGDTSPAEGQLPESVAMTSNGLNAQLSVDDGVVGWSVATRCIRVTPEEANKSVGPAS
ncbi:hypothetical protein SAMN04488570_2855 [Nocardioides scoriae]|uniref:Lipoprotein n=1 Tax=Nocardioides scoriae TaxID=642780 RepID=A0A1H1VJL0_9ACTN|nr:hypothetical protein [Nocardioides scoriae]SDS84972.1 hypothetical protein SAMN04488570_2855 [Nocardioides scoriae]